MRVALVHDWLVAQRGGENVLLELARRFPEAPIFTLVHAAGQVHPELESHPIHTSFIQRLPGAPRRFRRYLPLFPAAVSAFDLGGFDLVLSTSHCVAKGARTSRDQRHVAYIHTPMRYAWDQLPQYVPAMPGRRLLVPVAHFATRPLRRWDVESAGRPDVLLANSAHVARRVARSWGRRAWVLYPPVDVTFHAAAPRVERRGFLVVSALVPYKRVDLAVQVASERRLDLTVVGDGPERRRLERLAGPTVRFVAPLAPEALRAAYAGASALLFCGVEDFGIVPVEAMAAGCPVVALGQGGALETVVEHGEAPTGVLFPRPEPEELSRAIDRFAVMSRQAAFERPALARHARRFSRESFHKGLDAVLAQVVPSSGHGPGVRRG